MTRKGMGDRVLYFDANDVMIRLTAAPHCFSEQSMRKPLDLEKSSRL